MTDLSKFIRVARGEVGLDGVIIRDMGGGLLALPVPETLEEWERRNEPEPVVVVEPVVVEPTPPVDRRLRALLDASGLRIKRP